METQAKEMTSLTAAIERAARSLALARELVVVDDPPNVARARTEAKERVRAEIKRVTRLLESTCVPTDAGTTDTSHAHAESFVALNRAARQLDEETASLDRELHVPAG
jgi:hypothetical protein